MVYCDDRFQFTIIRYVGVNIQLCIIDKWFYKRSLIFMGVIPCSKPTFNFIEFNLFFKN